MRMIISGATIVVGSILGVFALMAAAAGIGVLVGCAIVGARLVAG